MSWVEVERSLAEAGWEIDGGFFDRLLVGNAGDLAILVPPRAWQSGERPAARYELYDAERHLSYWVGEVPTPQQAAELLEEHGEQPEEELD